MEDLEEAKSLLSGGRYREAGDLLDRILAGSEASDEAWYLRGIVFLKLKNYDGAQECFAHALLLGRKSKYFQMKGMAHFELFEMEDAAEAFREALGIEPDDPTTNFFLALSYMFLDDGRADEFIRKAYRLNSKKTGALLMNFYTLFLKDDPRIGAAQKALIEQRMKGLRS